MNIPELKPCPFCGGEPIFERQGDRRQSHIIYCGECGGRLETGETWNAGQLWNTRTEPQVKALVWERADLTCWGETAQNGMGGSYRMTWEFGEGPNGEDTFFTVRFDGVGLYSGWSFDADPAMAAAQADYTRRILDALT